MQLKWEWAGFGGNDQTEGCGHGSPLVAMKLRAYEPVAYRTYIFTGSISEMEEFVKSNTVQSQKGQFGTYDLHEKIDYQSSGSIDGSTTLNPNSGPVTKGIGAMANGYDGNSEFVGGGGSIEDSAGNSKVIITDLTGPNTGAKKSTLKAGDTGTFYCGLVNLQNRGRTFVNHFICGTPRIATQDVGYSHFHQIVEYQPGKFERLFAVSCPVGAAAIAASGYMDNIVIAPEIGMEWNGAGKTPYQWGVGQQSAEYIRDNIIRTFQKNGVNQAVSVTDYNSALEKLKQGGTIVICVNGGQQGNYNFAGLSHWIVGVDYDAATDQVYIMNSTAEKVELALMHQGQSFQTMPQNRGSGWVPVSQIPITDYNMCVVIEP